MTHSGTSIGPESRTFLAAALTGFGRTSGAGTRFGAGRPPGAGLDGTMSLVKCRLMLKIIGTISAFHRSIFWPWIILSRSQTSS